MDNTITVDIPTVSGTMTNIIVTPPINNSRDRTIVLCFDIFIY